MPKIADSSIRDLAKKLWGHIQDVIVFGGVLLLILIQIPGIDSLYVIDRLKVVDENSHMTIGAILAALYSKISEIIKNSGRTNDEHSTQVFRGAMEVYPVLRELIANTKHADQKTLQVIGMNLKTAWPAMNLFLPTGLLDGWSLEFATFFGGQNGSSASPLWAQESKNQARSIIRASQSPEVIDRKVTLSIYSYTFDPAVHGFRLGNGDIFVSILRRHDSGNLTLRYYTYEYIPYSDVSPAAAASRELFDSWWKAASIQSVSAGDI